MAKVVEDFIELMKEDAMWLAGGHCDVCETEVDEGVDGWTDENGLTACWECMLMCYTADGKTIKIDAREG